MAEKAVRNSVSLGVFLAVAAHPKVPFSVVELAGRGITADAAASRWVLEVGKPSLDGFALADKLIDSGEREDQLVELWQEYETGEVNAAAFETRLAEIVAAMEKWPSAPEGPVEDFSSRLRRVLGPGMDG
ncbi:CesT family type III secretion system chaperone [Streptomyces sp. NBC_00708]